MSNNGHFDLSGVFHVQQNYLTDLSNSYPNINNAPLIANYILDLQNKTKDVDSSYRNANTSADAVLTQQNNMIDIVTKEQERLDGKKYLIEQAEMGERRKVLLTDSNRLRNAEYTKIILCVVAGLTVHVVIRMMFKYFVGESSTPNLDATFIILHLVNILIWTIAIFYIYVNIKSRSQINFNELELPPPPLIGQGGAPATANYNNLFKDLGMCYSQSCCGENTTWDESKGACVKKEGFSTYVNTDPLAQCPKFTAGTRTNDIKNDPSDSTTQFIPASMSDSEIRAHVDKNVAKQFSFIGDSTQQYLNKMTDPSALSGMGIVGTSDTGSSDPMDLVVDSKDLPDTDDIPMDGPVKCNFATMEQAYSKGPESATPRFNQLHTTNISGNIKYTGMGFNEPSYAEYSKNV